LGAAREDELQWIFSRFCRPSRKPARFIPELLLA
jgi:hypothetical protein